MNKNIKIVELNGISFYYVDLRKESQILDNINFVLNEREILSILGPSGAGKTTLLKLIGNVFVRNDYIVKGNIKRKEKLFIGYISQRARLLPWLTMLENIELGVNIMEKRKNIDKEKINDEIDYYLKKTNLYKFRNYYPFQLSGGMKTRVLLIRAFIYHPDLMILDEPFNNLDEVTRYRIYDLLLDYWENNKVSIIIVTHNIREALYLSDKIIIIGRKPTTIIDEITVEKYKFRRKRKNMEIEEFENYMWSKLVEGNEERF